MSRKLDTPCIGVCSTIYGDEVCRGCKRFYQEIIDWNAYARDTKDKIFERLENFIIDAARGKLIVVDDELLRTQLEKLNIRHHHEEDPLCWAYYLLRQGHDRINDLNKYGVKVHPDYQDLTLTKLHDAIDKLLHHASYQAFLATKG
jgi:predicted Fe-S protein YdhL (DUF1289 family)